MTFDPTHNNKFTTKITKRGGDLGLDKELRRYAENEFLKTKKVSSLIGTSGRYSSSGKKGALGQTNVVDDDPIIDNLFLTNAVTEDKIQDGLDKKRDLKVTRSYVTVHSGARQTVSTTNIVTGPTLFTTGPEYVEIYPFAPYTLVVDSSGNPLEKDGNFFVAITSNNNHIQFSLQDWTVPTSVTQVLNPKFSQVFDVYLPASGTILTLDELQFALQTNINLVASTGKPLDNSSDPRNMFSINVFHHPTVNPDLANIAIQTQTNFQYIMTFFSYGDIESTAVAKPVTASDAAFVVQNTTSIYPNPNSYALDLNKAYTIVKAIRIISSEIPNSDTIINQNNCHITIRLINRTFPPPTITDPYSQNIKMKDGSIDWNIYLPYGNYTLDQLVAQMDTQINGMFFGETGLVDVFHFSANQTLNTFEITVNDPYAFKWDFNAVDNLKWRNLYSMLGFRESYTNLYTTKFTNVVSNNMGTYVTNNPYKPIMLRKSSIIWLQLNNYATMYDSLTQESYFCKFTLDNTQSGTYAYNTHTKSVQVFVDLPIPVLSTVDVRMFDELGNPYNFNGIDHSFTLEITHHIDRLKGTDFSSRRGVNDRSSYMAGSLAPKFEGLQ